MLERINFSGVNQHPVTGHIMGKSDGVGGGFDRPSQSPVGSVINGCGGDGAQVANGPSQRSFSGNLHTVGGGAIDTGWVGER